MTETDATAGTADECGCKVGRIVGRHDLTALDDELAMYWTGQGEERLSLRELAEYVNQEVLRAAMEDAGAAYKDGEVENTLRLLTDDDVSSGARTETRKELEHASVPVDQVEGDFISHQTVYNHLTNCLDVSMETPDEEERVDRARDKIRALQNRTVAVTDDTIDRLRKNDALDLGEFNVLVDVAIICEDCGNHFTAGDLLEQGSCDCESHDEA